MNVHLVVAHPEKTSFNLALHQIAINTFKKKDINTSVTNLYSEKFTANAGHADVFNFPKEESYNLAKAQRWAQKNKSFSEDIKTEQQKLLLSDLLILQFPLWWWSYPAILKGWIDRVLSSGFAYGEGAELGRKKVMYSITTGGANNQEELDYYQQKIEGLYQDVFGFIGWQIMPAFIAHGVQQKTQQQRTNILNNYEKHLLEQTY
jgi:NAD(P)H dehydrogenase (quinone)